MQQQGAGNGSTVCQGTNGKSPQRLSMPSEGISCVNVIYIGVDTVSATVKDWGSIVGQAEWQLTVLRLFAKEVQRADDTPNRKRSLCLWKVRAFAQQLLTRRAYLHAYWARNLHAQMQHAETVNEVVVMLRAQVGATPASNTGVNSISSALADYVAGV